MKSVVLQRIQEFTGILKWPLVILLMVFLTKISLLLFDQFFPDMSNRYPALMTISLDSINLILVGIFLWIAWRLLERIERMIQQHEQTTENIAYKAFLSILQRNLRLIIMLFLLNLIIPELSLTPSWNEYTEKLLKILLIGMIGWVLVSLVNTIEKIVLAQYSSSEIPEIQIRKIKTQTSIIKKIILTFIVSILIACCLLVFDSARKIGAGLLTTAGILSAIGAFASQQSLNRLLAGLQIAFSQPIRIGDTVIVDKELGTIEEITLSYVVIKIWDLRRLILPTNYLSEHIIQNLTLTSTQLLGTVYFYVDYTLPIQPVREKFHALVAESKFWDRATADFDVTEIKEHVMELRAVISSYNTDTLWKLRCEIREKMIQYLAEHHPDCFAKIRILEKSCSASS